MFYLIEIFNIISLFSKIDKIDKPGKQIIPQISPDIPYLSPQIFPDKSPSPSPSPPLLPLINRFCEMTTNNFCNELIESNFYDKTCYTEYDQHANLGCNAGGLKCCRFCEFGLYINITCVKSPSLPPYPFIPPTSPPLPPTPPCYPRPPTAPPPSLPPRSPRPCGTIIPNYCSKLVEKNYFDEDCFSYTDPFGNLGCNAGGLKCCRFCEFGYYENISCILSPSLPPYPPKNPLSLPTEKIFIPPKKSKIVFNVRIDSVIETFNRNIFKRRLLRKLHRSISISNIILRIRPGSLIVDVIILADDSVADTTMHIIENMTPKTMSDVLNISVAEFSAPIIENDKSEYMKNNLLIIMFILCVVSLFCIIVVIICNYKKLKKNVKKIIKLPSKTQTRQVTKQTELQLGDKVNFGHFVHEKTDSGLGLYKVDDIDIDRNSWGEFSGVQHV